MDSRKVGGIVSTVDELRVEDITLPGVPVPLKFDNRTQIMLPYNRSAPDCESSDPLASASISDGS